jgi:hypothetical protein
MSFAVRTDDTFDKIETDDTTERLNIRDLQQFQDFVARYEATEMYINQDPNQSMLEG